MSSIKGEPFCSDFEECNCSICNFERSRMKGEALLDLPCAGCDAVIQVPIHEIYEGEEGVCDVRHYCADCIQGLQKQ